MKATELVLIDLSSIAYPIYLVSSAEPDPNHTSQQIAARVRALANSHVHVAVCCDSGRSFRHEVSDTYKANRPEREEALHHQIALACEQLTADGFPIWKVKGFEADDLIATAAVRALTSDLETTVLIVSSDKDLLQLVGPRVRAMSAKNGDIFDAEAVAKKFRVQPAQMRDYLTLVGDASDNIKGAKGIGAAKAVGLLAKFGSLDALYEQLQATGGASIGVPSSVSAALREFQPSLATTRRLIELRTDVDLPFDEILSERKPKAAETFIVDEPEEEPETPAAAPPGPQAVPEAEPSTAIAVRDAEVLPAPSEWERGLDPRSMKDARVLAKDLHDSRMFSAYGTPQAVMSTIMVGRELGLPAMASLRAVHVIEGKQTLSASIMVALVLKSGLAEYFRPVSISATEATFETLRKGEGQKPFQITHTMEMAQQAGLVKPKSGWEKNPTDMLVARAQARLARLIYPDILAGLYTPEEMEDARKAVA